MSGRAFAALSPASLSAVHSSRSSTRNSYVEIPRESYWKNNGPVLEKIDWNGMTVMLPVLAPCSEQVQIKKATHKCTVQNIQSISKACEQDKVESLTNRFQEHAVIAKTEVNSALNDLRLHDSNVCEFSDVQLKDGTQRNVNLNNPLTLATRRNMRWIAFTLAICSRGMNTGNIQLDTTEFPAATTASVCLRALQQNNLLHPDITANILVNDLKHLIDICDDNDEDFKLHQTHRLGNADPEMKTSSWS